MVKKSVVEIVGCQSFHELILIFYFIILECVANGFAEEGRRILHVNLAFIKSVKESWWNAEILKINLIQ